MPQPGPDVPGGPSAAVDPCGRLDPRVERTRTVVLDTTRTLLDEVGLARTSIEAIAERSGVARSTIYRHWPSTAAVVMAALDRAKAEVERAVQSSGDDETDLRMLLASLGEMLRSPQSSLLAEISAAASRDAELAELHEQYLARRRAASIQLIGRLQSAGRLRSDIDPEEMTELVAAPLFYRRFNAHRPMGAAEVDRHTDLMFSLLAAD